MIVPAASCFYLSFKKYNRNGKALKKFKYSWQSPMSKKFNNKS